MVTEHDGGFSTYLDDELLAILYEAGGELGFDPLSSMEAEEYFLNLQQKIQSGEESVASIGELLREEFVSLAGTPKWIQNPEWQYESGVPVIFVGQIETPQDSIIGDKCFYIFHGKGTNSIKTVVQTG